jgi:small basic protein
MNEQQQTQFFHFHTINEFMLPEYRQQVLTQVITNLDSLPGELRSRLSGQIRQQVKVPGFRNSSLAPALVKVRGAIQAFERSPQLAANVLAAWSELNADLRQQIFDFLTERGWTLLPIDADRTKLPGFLTRWPKADQFDVLDEAFRVLHPESTSSKDDVSLMVVWLSMRLPYELVDTLDDESAAE